MPYTKAHEADGRNVLADNEKGELWFLREALDTEELGFSVLALEPHEEGMRHDHEDDQQEEIYYVVDGGVFVDFGDRREYLDKHEAMRISPDEERQIQNQEKFSKLVLVSTPA